MASFLLALNAIWNFLKKNPKLIVIGVLLVVLIVFFVRYQNRGEQIESLNTQVVIFQADTLQRGREKSQLQSDTAFYLRKLREAQMQLKALRVSDKKNNPDLVDEFPAIDTFKPPKR